MLLMLSKDNDSNSQHHEAESIKLKFVELDAVDDGYQFNADIEIVLNPTLKKALKKGIALYFVTDFRLVSPRWYWFDKRRLL